MQPEASGARPAMYKAEITNHRQRLLLCACSKRKRRRTGYDLDEISPPHCRPRSSRRSVIDRAGVQYKKIINTGPDRPQCNPFDSFVTVDDVNREAAAPACICAMS